MLPLLATLSTFFGRLPPIPDEATFEFRGDVQNMMSGMMSQRATTLVGVQPPGTRIYVI
jgi:hypothetical protein